MPGITFVEALHELHEPFPSGQTIKTDRDKKVATERIVNGFIVMAENLDTHLLRQIVEDAAPEIDKRQVSNHFVEIMTYKVALAKGEFIRKAYTGILECLEEMIPILVFDNDSRSNFSYVFEILMPHMKQIGATIREMNLI